MDIVKYDCAPACIALDVATGCCWATTTCSKAVGGGGGIVIIAMAVDLRPLVAGAKPNTIEVDKANNSNKEQDIFDMVPASKTQVM